MPVLQWFKEGNNNIVQISQNCQQILFRIFHFCVYNRKQKYKLIVVYITSVGERSYLSGADNEGQDKRDSQVIATTDTAQRTIHLVVPMKAITKQVYIYIHCIIPFRKFGLPYLGMAIARAALPILQVHAGSFRVSVIHRTLTWTTGSLTCLRDHYYAYVYTRGLGTSTASQHNICDSENLSQRFLAFLAGSSLWSLDLESDVLIIEPPRPEARTYVTVRDSQNRYSTKGS